MAWPSNQPSVAQRPAALPFDWPEAGVSSPVEAGATILESLRACGVNVPSSCQQGVCGACETRVICGKPDHRGMVLSDVEKAAGDTMMICCSGALTPELTLDI